MCVGYTPRDCGRPCSETTDSDGYRSDVRKWSRKNSLSGLKLRSEMDAREAGVLRSLVGAVSGLLTDRASSAPDDDLAALTGLRTGNATPPDDPRLLRLLPDFHRSEPGSPTPTAPTSTVPCAACTNPRSSTPNWPQEPSCWTPAPPTAAASSSPRTGRRLAHRPHRCPPRPGRRPRYRCRHARTVRPRRSARPASGRLSLVDLDAGFAAASARAVGRARSARGRWPARPLGPAERKPCTRCCRRRPE